jgi:hypothetical protein
MAKFKKVIQALNDGKRVRRSSWHQDKRFIFRQVPSEIPKEVVPKMQSLPQTVKDFFLKTFEEEQIDAIYYSDQLALVGLSNSITSYSPTVADSFASDWEILD